MQKPEFGVWRWDAVIECSCSMNEVLVVIDSVTKKEIEPNFAEE